MERARTFLSYNDGAKGIPSWGKFWLAVLNVYSWEGLHPIPPELWLLPYMLPIHPGAHPSQSLKRATLFTFCCCLPAKHLTWYTNAYVDAGRWWCHCRMVYLPMGYVFGRRISAPETPLVLSLRRELYPREDYDKIDWPSLRSYISPLDLYYPHTTLLETLYRMCTLRFYYYYHMLILCFSFVQCLWITTRRFTAAGFVRRAVN